MEDDNQKAKRRRNATPGCCTPKHAFAGLVVLAALYVAHEFVDRKCWSHVKSSPAFKFLKEVDVLETCSPEQLQSYKSRGLPVIIKDAMDTWPAKTKWLDLDYLKGYSPDSVLTIATGNLEQGETAYVEHTLASFIDWVQEHEDPVKMEEFLNSGENQARKMPYYAESSFLFEEVCGECVQVQLVSCFQSAALLEDINDFEPLLSKFGEVEPLFWLGPAGTTTGLHRDLDPTNILYQLKGAKRFWLYPPDQREFLYPSDKYDFGAELSLVDPWDVDNERFPLYKQARPLVVDLHAGEAIYVPAGWFHYVFGLNTSVSVSGRAESPCEAVSFSVDYFLNFLHWHGLYRSGAGQCTCHSGSQNDGGEY